MERRLAALAGQLDVLHAELLLGNHRRAEDGGAMTAARLRARPMLGPEGVDDLWPFVAILLPLLRCEGERIEVGLASACRRQYLQFRRCRTSDLVPARAFGDVERLNDRFDLGLDLVKELAEPLRDRCKRVRSSPRTKRRD